MRLHSPVEHHKQPHIAAGIPRPSFADGGSVGMSNSVDSMGSLSAGGGGSGGMQMTGTTDTTGGGAASPATSTGGVSSGGGGAGGGVNIAQEFPSLPSNIAQQIQNEPSGTGGGSGDASLGAGTQAQVGGALGSWQGGAPNGPVQTGTAAPAPAAPAQSSKPQYETHAQAVAVGQRAGQQLVQNMRNAMAQAKQQQGGAAAPKPATTAATPAPSGGQSMTGIPAAANTGGTTSSTAGAAPAYVGASAGSYEDGGVIQGSLNPLNRTLDMATAAIPSIQKGPSPQPTTYGPTKEQAGPARDQDQDRGSDADRPSYAEGGLVDPSQFLGSEPSNDYSQNNPSASQTGAGDDTVNGLVTHAQQTYQTVQQALQSAWKKSASTTNSAGNANMPGTGTQAAAGQSFINGGGAASGVPAPQIVKAGGASGQAQGAQLQTPQQAQQRTNNPQQAVANPAQTNTSNVVGTPAGGQPSAAGAQAQQPTPPTPPPSPQPPQPQDPTQGVQ